MTMNLFDTNSAMKVLEDGTVDAVKKFFPIEGRKNKLIAHNIYTTGDADSEDTAGQKRARTRGRTWATGVYGDISLVDKETGKTLDTAKGMKLLNLPKLTRRYSFIVDGAERQVDHQWRLKSGVYARQRANGELEAQFNLAKGRGFRMDFYPDKGQFLLRYHTTNIQLLPVLRAMGVPDEDIRHAWGAKAYDAIASRKSRGDLQKMAKSLDYKFAGSDEDAAKLIKEQMAQTELREDTTRITLGKPFDKVEPETLLLTSKKLLNINRGTDVVDNRDALQFKELWSIEDHIPERLANSGKRIQSKIRNNIDRKDSVRDIVTSDVFNVPIKSFFTGTSLSQLSPQTNPVEMIGGFTRTTIMGTGAIGSEQAVSMNAKMSDPSSLGFIDPLHTPEGGSSGVSTHLTLGVSKRGKEPLVKVYDMKRHVLVEKTPAELAGSTVGFGDQFEVVGDKPVARAKLVSVIPAGGGDPTLVAPKEVDFILRSPKSMFSITSNMIPFLPSDQPNRAGMGTRHMEQTVSLKYREAPLVQTATGSEDNKLDTWEKVVGRTSAHHSPVDGTVTAITPDQITVKDKDGVAHNVGLYDNYPLNEKKTFITSEPQVKVGDKVARDDLLADTNFTKNGTLALGINLRVGYLDWHGGSVSGDTRVFWTAANGVSSFGYIRDMPRAASSSFAVDPKSLAVESIPVHAHMLHAPDSPMYKLTTSSGISVKATGSHSFITIDRAGALVEIKPGEMHVGRTLVPRAQPRIAWKPSVENYGFFTEYGRSKLSAPLDADMGFLFGMYVAEGSISQNKATSIAVTESALVERLQRICGKLGVTGTHSFRHAPNGVSGKLDIHCAAIAQTLARTCGCLAQNKRVPDLLWNASREFACGFIDGYWSGDGTVGKQATASTASHELAEGLMFLLAAFGVRTSLGVHKVVRGERQFQDQHLISTACADVGRLPHLTLAYKETAVRSLADSHRAHSQDRIPIPRLYREAVRNAATEHGLERSINFASGYTSREILRVIYDDLPAVMRKLVDAPLWWDTVDAIEDAAHEDIVYDLDMRPHANFLVGPGLVVHNTFEDGIVVSESAAKKLTSLHLHKPRTFLDRGMTVGLDKFRANFPGEVTNENAKKLDEDGVIKKGQTVNPGDVIMTVLKKNEPSPEQIMLKGIHKALVRPYKNAAVKWDKDTSGVVTDVVRNGSEIVAYVATEEPLEVADKLSARHGNKGVVSRVVPDEEMPRNKAGEPLEIMVSPSGVPGRINLGQVLETMLGKAADKTGTFAVDNFQSDTRRKIVHVHGFFRNVHTDTGIKRVWVHPYDREVGYQELVKDAMKDAGVEAAEEMYDPGTGKSFGKVLTGKQYFIKLMHQVDKGMAARSYGYGNDYDANMTPKGGGHAGAKRYSELGLYAMLAHGSLNEIRDAMTYKSDRAQQDVWTAIQTGEPLPPPKTAFAYEKFLAYLKAVGLNVDKEGNELRLVPYTDAQIKAHSHGELKDASKVLRGKDLRPEPGGLFDEKITGGPGGKNWSHIKLETPVPNPVFERAITSLIGITGKQYDDVLAGVTSLDGKTGPGAIVAALGKLSTDKELARAKEDLKTSRKSTLNEAYKRVKYLQALKNAGMTPVEAYVTSSIPVLPPVFRPITAMEGGDLNVDGVNLLYRDIAMINAKLREAEKVLPEASLVGLRKELYTAVESLAGSSSKQEGMTVTGDIKPPGILTILSGRTSPKDSFVHEKLMDRRQDLTLSSVITPDMTLGLDEVSLPREGAFAIFRPFVVRELVQMGYTPLSAREEIDKRSTLANRALEVAITKRPVFLKRDPVLHKFGIMAFWARLNDGKDIKIHPLSTGGFNADFDGDKMAAFVPITSQAVEEAKRMLPSNNLFNFASGSVMHQPTLGGQLGLFLLTHFGKETGKVFDTQKDAIDALHDGSIQMTDVVKVAGKKTTAGRISVYAALPEAVRTDSILTEKDMVLEKKALQRIMRDMANKSPKEFAVSIDKLKNLGFSYMHDSGFSFEAGDFDTLYQIRDDVLKHAHAEVAAVRNTTLSNADKDKKAVEIYTRATAEMTKRAKVELEKRGNKLYAMHKAGVKPAWEQVQQMVLAPMLLANANGRVIPSPVTRSYSEGIDSADYWVASSGARKGLINKVQSVQKPGVLSKQMINATIPYVVTEHDCHTHRGVLLEVNDPDLIGRLLPKDIVVGKETYKEGTLLTPNVIDKLKQGKVAKVLARSVLKCQAKQGLCASCYGAMPDGKLPDIGVNLGVLAGQSIGERGTQLSMKEFHLGGLAGTSSRAMNGLDRTIELLRMPETLPDAATLAAVSGKVQSVHKSPLGGHVIKIGDEEHYAAGSREPVVKVGDEVSKGDRITDGSVDPRQLLDLTDIDRVQRHMSDELYSAYSGEGVKRRNSEVVVKALTNLGRVVDPGDSDEFIRNDMVSLNYVDAMNKEHAYKNPIRVEPVLKGLETLPLDRTTDWLARLEYRKLKETYTRGAAEGWASNIHGMSPIPGVIYSAQFGRPPEGNVSPY